MPLVIAKTVLPDAQKFYLALGRIFGIGRAQGLAIAEEVGISKEARVSDVKANHVRQVSSVVCCSLTSCRGVVLPVLAAETAARAMEQG